MILTIKIFISEVEMLGAIIGDILGSRYEFRPNRSKEFDLFLGEG